ncbi:glycine betaine ABC transporter substrate-binding protein [Methylocella sp.]|uniref:glycine betaine ABC transporter substrate-binding protein n=1 Tax=Methylocella sp. TaxID=1978226 RepID=UPI003783ABF4
MNTTIRLGHIDLSFHAASAAVVQAVMQDHGHEAITSAAPHEEMFRRMGRGEVDMLVSAWLPASHAAYLAPFEKDVRKIVALYRPYCLWGVPDFVPASEIATVSDLLKPVALERMERRIQGINPGAGISRFSKAMVEQYGLAAAGYHFEPGTEEECFGAFERAVAERRWIVIPLWSPQYLHHTHKIRELSDPKGLLGGTDDATLILREDAAPRVAPSALAALGKLRLGNDVVTALDYALRVEGLTPLDAARAWLKGDPAAGAR